MDDGAHGGRVDITRALRDAGVTALVAFGLFLPLIGFQTVTNVRNDLILVTRWPLLVATVAIVGFGRLAYSIAIEPRLRQRTLQRAQTPAWRTRLRKWFAPFAVGFVIAYPIIVVLSVGFGAQ